MPEVPAARGFLPGSTVNVVAGICAAAVVGCWLMAGFIAAKSGR